jgi:uncharacterized phage-associated protein
VDALRSTSTLMSPVSGHDVARELRRRLPSAGVVKIHKLLYYCKAWSVAWNDDPLFAERIEAWAQGPVVADVWHDEHRGREAPAEQELIGAQLAVVDYVVRRYGDLSGEALRDRTHEEAPWREMTGADGQLVARNAEITNEALRRWFTSDAEYLAHHTEADRLRARRDIYAFAGDPLPPAVRSATERVLRERAPGRTA